MIDYDLLCQTIEDWRAGRRPSIDLSAAPLGSATAEAYGDVDGEPPYEGDPGQYGDPNQAYGYDEESGAYAYDGAPAPVGASGTSPMEVSDLEYEG